MSQPPLDFPALLSRYERPLIQYARGIVGDLDTARDVVQETFLRLVRHGSPPGDDAAGSHLTGWLFTVCRNCALDHQRKYSRLVPMTLPDDRPADDPSPFSVLERRDVAASLLTLLEGLSENQREVIRLKFQHDLSYREIADVTQLSVTNVGFLLHTGLKKLRSLATETAPDLWPAAARPLAHS